MISSMMAGVVDQNVELREIVGDLFVKSAIDFRIGKNVARKEMEFLERRFRTAP